MSSGDFNAPDGTDGSNKIETEQQICSLPTSQEEEQTPDSTTATTSNEGVENLCSFSVAKPTIAPEKTHVNGFNNVSQSEEQAKMNEIASAPEKQTKEDLGLKSPLAQWMIGHNVSTSILRLLYWKELLRTAGIFGGVLVLLFALQTCSFICVTSTFALSLLTVAALYHIGMTVVNAFQKKPAEHPFKGLLEENIELSEDTARIMADKLCKFINKEIKCLQRLFLCEDLLQSLKFGVTLWLISYIGSILNFITTVTLVVVILFTIPKLYEEKQAEIDQAFSIAKSKFVNMTCEIEARLPEKIKKHLGKDKKE